MLHRGATYFGEPTTSEGLVTAPSEWAPRPDLYDQIDGMGAEIEVFELLAALVRATKPSFVVETGTHLGRSALALLDALRRNEHGRMVTIEILADCHAAAVARLQSAMPDAVGHRVGQCDAILGSSLDYTPSEHIDFLFCDSGVERAAEILHMRPYLSPRAFVAVHDTLKHRTWTGDMESLIPWVQWLDIPTPRGLTIGRVR